MQLKLKIRKNERNTRLDLTQLYVHKPSKSRKLSNSDNLTAFDQK